MHNVVLDKGIWPCKYKMPVWWIGVFSLPVCLKCFSVTLSTGKKLRIAPYSGHIFAIVVRSAIDSWETPVPKNSTNFPAIPACLSCCLKENTITIWDTRRQWQRNIRCNTSKLRTITNFLIKPNRAENLTDLNHIDKNVLKITPQQPPSHSTAQFCRTSSNIIFKKHCWKTQKSISNMNFHSTAKAWAIWRTVMLQSAM